MAIRPGESSYPARTGHRRYVSKGFLQYSAILATANSELVDTKYHALFSRGNQLIELFIDHVPHPFKEWPEFM